MKICVLWFCLIEEQTILLCYQASLNKGADSIRYKCHFAAPIRHIKATKCGSNKKERLRVKFKNCHPWGVMQISQALMKFLFIVISRLQ